MSLYRPLRSLLAPRTARTLARSARFLAEETPKPDAPAADEDLQAQLKDATAKAAELEDKYRRSLADMENLRSRSRVEVKQAQEFGIQKFARDLVGVADVLDMAIGAVPKDELNDTNPSLVSLHEGLVGTQHMLLKVFSSNGLEQINPLGEKFDPNLHEAQFEMADPSREPGTVGAVTKTGYVLNSRLIRSACVGVVKK